MRISIGWGRALLALLLLDGVFVVAHLLTQVELGASTVLPSDELLDLDVESGLATWWQQSKLVLGAVCCALAALVSHRQRPDDHRYWVGLAAVLIAMSVDEGSELHERLIVPMRDRFGIEGGPLYFAWVVPIGVLVILLGGVFIRFWSKLPGEPRRLFSIALVLFVSGALGFEMVSGELVTSSGRDRSWELAVAAEEGLEMLGATLFIHAVLSWLRTQGRSHVLHLHFTAGPTVGHAPPRGWIHPASEEVDADRREGVDAEEPLSP